MFYIRKPNTTFDLHSVDKPRLKVTKGKHTQFISFCNCLLVGQNNFLYEGWFADTYVKTEVKLEIAGQTSHCRNEASTVMGRIEHVNVQVGAKSMK